MLLIERELFVFDSIIYSIEGLSDSIKSLTFNTIKTKRNMHAVHSSRYLKSKLMFNLSRASMVKIGYSSKCVNPLY